MADFDLTRYRELVADAAPMVIDSEEDYDRLIDRAQHMMERGPQTLSAEEARLLELLVFLIEAAHHGEAEDEDQEPAVEAEIPAPHETLARLLQSRGLELADIEHIFGNPRAAREFMEGRRQATRGQAKQLGRFFQVPDKLFLA